jgi:hypothetical protein
MNPRNLKAHIERAVAQSEKENSQHQGPLFEPAEERRPQH